MNPRVRTLIPIAIAVVLAAVAVVLTRQYIEQALQHERLALEQEREQLKEQYKNPVDVIVATQDITEGQTITLDQLAVRAIPEDLIQPYATMRPNDVVGQVAIAPIAQGEQVLRNKVRSPQEARAGIPLSEATPRGKRAVTLGLDALKGVGGLVRPGDSVDVLWTFHNPDPTRVTESITVTLLQDVSVLAVDDQIVGKTEKETAERRHFTVTLALTPEESALVLFARDNGEIELGLRSPADVGRQVEIPPMNMEKAMELVLGKEPKAVERPASSRNVEVYRGLERSVVPVAED